MTSAEWVDVGVGHPVEDIVPSISLDALLYRREALLGAIQKTRDAYEEMRHARCALFDGNDDMSPSHCDTDTGLEWMRTRRDFAAADGMDEAVRRVDAVCWTVMLARSGLEQLMDRQQRAEWRKQIDEHKTPEFTRENVVATFESLAESRTEIFERGVVNVFKGLSWDYKTNSPVKIGKRMIVKYACERFAGPSHTFADKLDDLVRAFCVLERKPEPAHDRGAYATLSRGAWMKDPDGDGSPENVAELQGYLRFKGFKNGNAHITFLRLDLVDQLNRIIAKHFPNALPPAKEAA